MRILIIMVSSLAIIFTQSEQPYPPLELVSIPTAGTLPKGSYTYKAILIKDGGLTPQLAVGLSDNLTFGVAYTIHNLIGNKKPEYNSFPGFIIKYRLFSESIEFPALLIGLNTQGKGKWIEKGRVLDEMWEVNRYEQKALGFYLIASKNWNVIGNLGLHIGMSKNTWENSDGDDDINFFIGLDKELNRSFSFLMECDAALNSNEHKIEDLTLGRDKGYVNAALRWAIVSNILFEINFNDIRNNSERAKHTNREIKITYSESF